MQMLKLKLPAQLKRFCLNHVVDKIDSDILEFYSNGMKEIAEERESKFGNLKCLTASASILIIDELIRKEKLSYQHLNVLLPTEAERFTCNEDTEYSPFNCNTIKLISGRCSNFEMLHCYNNEGCINNSSSLNLVLRESICRLKNLLEINFRDLWIEDETIRIITLNCSRLKDLNLHGTNLSNEALNYLHFDESVLKNSLTRLIIDETVVSAEAVAQCLLKLKKLTHFLSDETIQACLNIFKRKCSDKTEIFPTFQFTLFKGCFYLHDKNLLNLQFNEWFIRRFPKVDHLVFVAIFEYCTPIITNIVCSWQNITKIELSSCNWYGGDSFDQLRTALKSCSKSLITLKLESFVNVDISYLRCTLKNLEKISLINNTYRKSNERGPFENLREVEIILIGVNIEEEICKDFLYTMHMNNTALISIFSAKNLEKVFIYDQSKFTHVLIQALLQLGYFRNLKELNIFSCPIKMIGLWEMFEKDIPLKKIVIGFCPFIRVSQINDLLVFIKEKDSYNEVSISVTMEVPYHLRSILKNL